MNEDDVKKIWKSSTDKGVIRLEKSRLINEVQSDVDRWIKMSKYRNTILGIILLFPIGILGGIAFTSPLILEKIGATLCLISFIYNIIRSISAKKLKPRAYSVTYLHYLYKIKEYLKIELKLSNETLYLLFPLLAIGFLLILISSFKTVQHLIFEILILIILGIIIYFFHKRITHKEYKVKLEKVEELIKNMEA